MTEMTNPTPSDPGGATAPAGGTQDGNSMVDGGVLEDDGSGLGAPAEASRRSSTPPHGDPLGVAAGRVLPKRPLQAGVARGVEV